MRSRKLKIWAAMLTALALVIAATGAVYGYLSAQSGPVTNTFTPETEEKPSITNDYKVSVGNTGYDVYVRAAVVVTWKDGSGNVYAEMPTYTVPLGTDWFEHDGFYYYTNKVASGDSTTDLLTNTISATSAAPSGYSLHVEIIAQTIQALGTTDGNAPIPAVQDAWGIQVSNGQLVDPTP